MRRRLKSLIMGWENTGEAAVSCSSHAQQELREAYSFLIMCFGIESVMLKSVVL